ncbi:hypothetical protein M1D55_12770 [Cupriavidus sp. JZ107]
MFKAEANSYFLLHNLDERIKATALTELGNQSEAPAGSLEAVKMLTGSLWPKAELGTVSLQVRECFYFREQFFLNKTVFTI